MGCEMLHMKQNTEVKREFVGFIFIQELNNIIKILNLRGNEQILQYFKRICL